MQPEVLLGGVQCRPGDKPLDVSMRDSVDWPNWGEETHPKSGCTVSWAAIPD